MPKPIIIHIHQNKQKTDPIYTIITLYHRPTQNPDIIEHLQKLIDNIHTKHPRTEIIIQGDLNINLLTLKPHPSLSY